jgi:hypothetical protein
MSIYTKNGSRLMAWMLLFVLLFSAVVTVQPAAAASSKDLERKVYTAMQNAVKYYYNADRAYHFDDFDWELIGLAQAGEKLDSRKWQDKHDLTAFDFWATKAKELDEAGQFAKLAIALMKNGYDPTNFNGKNLLEEIAKRQDANGRMGDDTYTIFNHVLSIVALEMYGYDYDREKAAEFLLKRYDDFSEELDTYTDDIAFTLHALHLLGDIDGVEEEKEKILDRLEKERKADGSIAGNPDSTMEALTALTSVGEDVLKSPWDKSVEYVLDNQLEDGSFQSAWSNGETSAMTTEKGLISLATIRKGTTLYERLTSKEKAALTVYLSKGEASEDIHVFDGMTNLLKGKEVKPSKNTYTIASKQLFVRADVKEIADEERPLAVLVKVMKGKQVVDTGIVEAKSADAEYVTAGFTLARGTYTVEVNYWYGLGNNPEVAKDGAIFAVTVK